MAAGASELLAADLLVHSTEPIPDEYERHARAAGLATARTVTFRSMVVDGDRFVLVAAKSVSPAYPLRGELRIADVAYAASRVSGERAGAGQRLDRSAPRGNDGARERRHPRARARAPASRAGARLRAGPGRRPLPGRPARAPQRGGPRGYRAHRAGEPCALPAPARGRRSGGGTRARLARGAPRRQGRGPGGAGRPARDACRPDPREPVPRARGPGERPALRGRDPGGGPPARPAPLRRGRAHALPRGLPALRGIGVHPRAPHARNRCERPRGGVGLPRAGRPVRSDRRALRRRPARALPPPDPVRALDRTRGPGRLRLAAHDSASHSAADASAAEGDRGAAAHHRRRLPRRARRPRGPHRVAGEGGRAGRLRARRQLRDRARAPALRLGAGAQPRRAAFARGRLLAFRNRGDRPACRGQHGPDDGLRARDRAAPAAQRGAPGPAGGLAAQPASRDPQLLPRQHPARRGGAARCLARRTRIGDGHPAPDGGGAPRRDQRTAGLSRRLLRSRSGAPRGARLPALLGGAAPGRQPHRGRPLVRSRRPGAGA